MTHPSTTLPADKTSPTSPAPEPGWGDPVTPRTPPGPRQPGWARLADPDGNNILANDVKESGTMYLRVHPSDKYIEISGATFHKVS